MLFSSMANAQAYGNGSTDPNDYQYRLTVTAQLYRPMPKYETYNVLGHTYTFMDEGHTLIEGRPSLPGYDLTKYIVFDYTFHSYDSVLTYIPLLYNKLYELPSDTLSIKISLTIVGLTMTEMPFNKPIPVVCIDEQYYSEYSLGSIYSNNYHVTADSNNNFTYWANDEFFVTKRMPYSSTRRQIGAILAPYQTIINLMVKQYGDPQNQLYETNETDGARKTIYTDKYGDRYVFDNKVSFSFVKYNGIVKKDFDRKTDRFSITDL